MTKNLMSKIFVREEDELIPMGHGIDHHDANNNNHGEQQKHKQHSQHQQQHHHHQQLPISNHYNVNLQYDSIF
jgi:hypothetical protein